MLGKEFTSIRSASIAQIGSKVINRKTGANIKRRVFRDATECFGTCEENIERIFY